jgi:uncharacterized delta-60 repeat protein
MAATQCNKNFIFTPYPRVYPQFKAALRCTISTISFVILSMKNLKPCCFWFLSLVILALLGTNEACAQAGAFDTSFSGDGKVTTAIGSSQDETAAMLLQPDGKILVAGSSIVPNYDFALVRYNVNGSLDNTFSGDGKVTVPIGTSDDMCTAMALQADGKIVLAGYTDNNTDDDFAIMRFKSNGTLDSTFSSDGILTTDFGGYDRIYSVVIQSDGKILVAGWTDVGSSTDFALARYTSNGTLDNGFSGDGKQTVDIDAYADYAWAVTLQPDNKILVTGSSDDDSLTTHFGVVRLGTDGTLDNSFSGDGKTTVPISSEGDYPRAIHVLADGKILIAGAASYGDFSYSEFVLVRLKDNGDPDNTFSNDGIVTTRFGTSYDDAMAMAVQGDGKILMVGYSDFAGYDFALARYNSNGIPDSTFSMDGRTLIAIGNSTDQAYAVAIQPDNKIVIAGSSIVSSNFDFCVIRLKNDITSGIEKVANRDAIRIVPNPARNEIRLQIPTENIGSKPAMLRIYSASGKLSAHYSVSGKNEAMQLDLTPGVYMYELKGENLRRIASGRLLVE